MPEPDCTGSTCPCCVVLYRVWAERQNDETEETMR
jgi:hypothetical protein